MLSLITIGMSSSERLCHQEQLEWALTQQWEEEWLSHLSVEKKELLSPEAKKLTRRVHEIPCVVFLLGNLWEAEKGV